MRRRGAAVSLTPSCYVRYMGFIGAFVGMIPVVLVAAGLAALGVRLRRRAMDRGQYPHRDLPWYLGGVPDIELETPQAEPIKRRRR
jgi:hypothetical protein